VALSIRAQVYAVCLGLFLPVVGVMFVASAATYDEQLSYAIQDAARFSRLIADQAPGALAPPEWDSLLSTARTVLPPDAHVWLVDEEGATQAGQPPADLDAFVTGTAAVASQPVRVQVALPRAEVMARVWLVYRRNFLTAITATLAVAIAGFILSRRWRRGLVDLEDHARRVGARDREPVALPHMPSSEMAMVQKAFVEMESNLVLLERQLVRQERLAAIGVLASGLAHELNNPLQVIAGRAQLILHGATVVGSARADLDLIRKESERASIIIRNLSRFTRQTPIEPEPVRLSDVIASIVELRQRRIEQLGVHLVVDDASTATVQGVFAELQQVVLNFVVNAEQALAGMDRGPRQLAIRTRDLAGAVYCEVEDSGPGVPLEDESKLFQPFFTTKAVGEGTGLGLSISYGIIESHGGRIGHRRPDTGGATFWFELPRSA
jgi:signal transduction histidine kinase